MTFLRWRELNPDVQCVDCDGYWQVFSSDPALWHLDDWFVSSAVSGPSVILCYRQS